MAMRTWPRPITRPPTEHGETRPLLARRDAGCVELPLHGLSLVRNLQPAFEHRDRLVRAAGEPQGMTEVVEGVGIVDVRRPRGESGHGPEKDGDGLVVAALL